MQNNKGFNSLVRDRSEFHTSLYTDNLCFSRCLALSRGADIHNLERHVEAFYKMYEECTPDAPPMNEFTGFKLSHLYNVEKIFHTNICL